MYVVFDNPAVMYPLSFVVGLLFGSFVTLASYRLPRDEPIGMERSNCPVCKHKLGFWDLFPVFSWVLLRGRCRYCNTYISARYPLIELIQGLLFVAVYARFGATPEGAIIALLTVCLLIVIVVDFAFSIIPDEVQVVMFVLGVVHQLVAGAAWTHFIVGPALGLGIGYGLRLIFWWWKKKEALGMGDVKFLAVVGIFLPIDLIITFLFMAGVIGIITALVWRFAGKGVQFPFGPALAVSLLICLFFPTIPDVMKTLLVDAVLEYH